MEEYLNDTNDAAQKAKRLLSGKKDLVRILEYFWRQQNLAQRFTLQDLVLLDCYSAFDEEIADKLPNMESIKLLRHFRLGKVLGTSRRLSGGRPMHPIPLP